MFECWRIQNGIRNQEITPLEILSFIGRRGMGALEFVPESSGIGKAERLNMKALTDLAQRIFIERENVRLMPEESLTMRSLMVVANLKRSLRSIRKLGKSEADRLPVTEALTITF